MTILFDKSIYTEKAVRQAIEDYKSIAKIELFCTSEHCDCSIISSEYPMKTTALEFSNYVLNLTVMSENNI